MGRELWFLEMVLEQAFNEPVVERGGLQPSPATMLQSVEQG